ncbi:MAG TPA: YdbH domain-containing protein [Opitutaceae bacterium]
MKPGSRIPLPWRALSPTHAVAGVRGRLCAFVVACGLVGHTRPGFAANFPLPLFAGDLSGELSVLGESGPQLQWRIDATTTTPAGRRQARLSLEGPALRAVATAELDAATGEGAWRIEEGRIDVGPWLQALGGRLPAEARGIEAEGVLVLRGSGEIHRYQPAGLVSFEWREGVIRDPGRGVTLEGVTASGEADLARLTDGGAPLELTVRTISTRRFGARNLAVRAVLRGTRELAVSAASIEIAGGTMEADPFVMPLAPFSVNAKVRVERIGLQDVVALVPSGLAEAHGRVDGEVWLGWSAAAGVQVGQGKLALHAGEPATLRLAPTPGFLTERVPRRIELPAWLGPLARWFSPDNPAYDDMEEVELGRTELRVEAFDAHITPEGDGQGRSAHVTVRARPLRPGGEIDAVTFDVNVAGPLADVLKIGLTQPFSVQVR